LSGCRVRSAEWIRGGRRIAAVGKSQTDWLVCWSVNGCYFGGAFSVAAIGFFVEDLSVDIGMFVS
jgi:hypothetical protein